MIEKLAPIGFAALALLGVAAKGAVDTHSVHFNSILNSPEYSVSLPKFDPALGTLQSVKFSLGTSALGVLTFDNESAVAGNVALTYGFSTTVSTDTPLITSLTASLFNVSGNGSVTVDNDGVANFTGTDAFGISGNGSKDQSSPILTGASYLSQYTANSPGANFMVRVNNTTAENVGPTTTAGIFGATRQSGGWLSGNLTVAYTYALAPIPEAVSTLWGAALGIFAIGRRKRVRRA